MVPSAAIRNMASAGHWLAKPAYEKTCTGKLGLLSHTPHDTMLCSGLEPGNAVSVGPYGGAGHGRIQAEKARQRYLAFLQELLRVANI